MATSTSKVRKARASNKDVNAERRKQIIKRSAIAFTCIFVALFIFDLTPFGGSMRFYAKWIECGSRPLVISGSGYFNAGVPHYDPAPTIALIRGSEREYFCTALEAEQAGYSANERVYSFPEKDKLRDEQK